MRFAAPVLFLAVLGFASVVCAEPQPQSAPRVAERTTVVISDLHFGVGKDDKTGEWDAFEDFRWEAEFKKFLDAINSTGQGKTDLVLNGDTFELWQAHDGNCKVGADKNKGCTETEAVSRIERVLTQHKQEVQHLLEFARSGDNRVYLVPGNHDAALLFEKVGSKVLTAFENDVRVKLETSGYFQSTDGIVYAEHGHMIGSDPNKFTGWPKPFVSTSAPTCLERPWGEQFVVDYYNQWELKYPIVDNVSEEFYGAKLAMKVEGTAASANALGKFFKFFFLDVSWKQFSGVAGGGDGGSIDVETISHWSGRQLATLLPPEDPIRPFVADGTIKISGKDFTPQELQFLCERAYAAAKAANPGASNPCSTHGGAIMEGIRYQDKLEILRKHLTHLRETKFAAASAKKFSVYVWSHTHRAEKPVPAFDGADWMPQVVNTGAWQRVVTPTILRSSGLSEKEQLGLSVSALPACYTFVRVAAGSSTAKLLAWRKVNGSWKEVEGSCENAPLDR